MALHMRGRAPARAGWRQAARPAASVVARASSARSRPLWEASPQQLTPEQLEKRSQQLRELLQESANIALQTGEARPG